MRYRTFVGLRTAALAGLVASGGWLMVRGCQPGATPAATTPSRPAVVAVGTEPAPARVAPSPRRNVAAKPTGPQSLTDLHREVLRRAKEPLSNGTSDGKGRKWRIKQGSQVIELRCDESKGFKTWNRVKLDLDRDKQWDEAWDLRPDGGVKRRVAPNDDENYSVTYDLEGGAWVRRAT